MSESQLQAQFIKTVWNEYPQLRHLLWSIPNDAIGSITGVKDVLRINELKATGLLSGVWDIGLQWSRQYHIIETKLHGNTLTRDRDKKDRSGNVIGRIYGQWEYGRRMAAQGAMRHIYHSIDEGVIIVQAILTGYAKDGSFMKSTEL